MSEKRNPARERRQFLKLLGGGAALVTLTGLSGCSGEEPPKPAAPAAAAKPDPKPEPKPAAKPAPAPAPAPTASGADLPRLSEDDAQAKALAYVHDATKVDKAAQPRYEAGQACKNCALYTGGDEPWGGCALFPGKAVNANGWCSAYAPKPT